MRVRVRAHTHTHQSLILQPNTHILTKNSMRLYVYVNNYMYIHVHVILPHISGSQCMNDDFEDAKTQYSAKWNEIHTHLNVRSSHPAMCGGQPSTNRHPTWQYYTYTCIYNTSSERFRGFQWTMSVGQSTILAWYDQHVKWNLKSGQSWWPRGWLTGTLFEDW